MRTDAKSNKNFMDFYNNKSYSNYKSNFCYEYRIVNRTYHNISINLIIKNIFGKGWNLFILI